MSRSRKSVLFLFASAFAVALLGNLGGNLRAEAGSGWGWKKPMNQRMGAFYTSNKAFHRSSSSSSRYQSSSRYRRPASYVKPQASTRTAPPVHQKPQSIVIPQPAHPTAQTIQQGVQATSQSVTIKPAQSPAIAPQTNSAAPLKPVQPPATNIGPEKPATNAAPVLNAKQAQPVKKQTLSVEQQALELLGQPTTP